MSTAPQPKPQPEVKAIDPSQKPALLMAISQLDMLVEAFSSAPPDVLDSAKAFKTALERWANQ